MITEINEDLFELNVDALAHGCNTKGKMDAGIAKEFKMRFPLMFEEYSGYCYSGLFKVGDIHFYTKRGKKPYIVNIATQITPHSGARLEYIERGLKNVRDVYTDFGIKSLAMPKIGCGLGGLDWLDVRKIIGSVFGSIDLEVIVALGKSTHG